MYLFVENVVLGPRPCVVQVIGQNRFFRRHLVYIPNIFRVFPFLAAAALGPAS
jgi:hypothetical protein